MRRPDFFIIGAPRCGTTALYAYLRRHPDIFMPNRKEPVYFGSDLRKRPPYLDERRYLALFDDATTERRVGEATVWYLYSQAAPHEIRAFDPEARVIAMVRNPVEMLPSLHSLLVYTRNEDVTDFEAALALEPERAAGRRLPAGTRRPEGLRYRDCADYAPHLRRWFEVLGRERVHVIVFDDLRRDAAAVYAETLRFLGVDPTFRPDFAIVNRNKRARSARLQRLIHAGPVLEGLGRLPDRLHHVVWRALMRLNSVPEDRPPLDPEMRQRLVAEMAPRVADLETLLGRDLSAWRTA